MRLTNNWIHGDCLKELKKLPDESVIPENRKYKHKYVI